MSYVTRVKNPFQLEPATIVLDIKNDTEVSLDYPTRCGTWSRGEELHRLAAKIPFEIIRGGVRGLQAIARHHSLDVTGGRWLQHDGHELVTMLAGTDDQSCDDIAGQLSHTAWLLSEVERRICALLSRDVRVVFADMTRVELVENPAYTF